MIVQNKKKTIQHNIKNKILNKKNNKTINCYILKNHAQKCHAFRKKNYIYIVSSVSSKYG